MRLIDADELIEHAWRDKLDSRELIVEMIDNAPTVKEISIKIPINVFKQLISQETRKGHWEHGKELGKEYQGRILVDVTYMDWHCSNCNYVIKGTVKPKWNYCPNCGSKMVEPQESEGLDKLNKTISDVAYILDSLILLRQIQQTGDCNICKNRDCE